MSDFPVQHDLESMPRPHSGSGALSQVQRVFLVSTLAVGTLLSGLALPVHAQAAGPQMTATPHNVVSLSAQAEREVPQDWLTITMSTVKEGKTAAEVQQAIRQDLDAALAEAKAASKSGNGLQVRTGRFSLYPRYNSTGRIASWQGSSDLVLEGRNFELIGGLAGKLTTMSVGSVEFSLSSEARSKVMGDLEGEAIDHFRERAQTIATRFGFKAYDLREVAISENQQGQPVYRPQVAMMQSKVMSDAVPVEAGKSTVAVTVSGSVELKP